MADIQESSLPRLPEELGNRDISKLEGHFNLQVFNVPLNGILNLIYENSIDQI